MEKKLLAENSVLRWIDWSENMSTKSLSSSSLASLLNFRKYKPQVSTYEIELLNESEATE